MHNNQFATSNAHNLPNTIQISTNPDNFKTHPCFNFFTYGYCTITQKCPFYHNQTDRRRCPISPTGELLYQPTFCPSLLIEGECAAGDACQYAHNSYEKDYHPYPSIQEPIQAITNPAYGIYSDFMIREYNQSEELLDISTFKINPCPLQIHHNQKHCINYHSEKDRRRDPKSYSSEKCKFFESKQCPNGNACLCSHNNVEKLYHPEKYKTKFCNDYFQSSCSYGGFCSFAHSEKEIEIELIHNMKQDEEFFMFYFKTVWCPFNFEHNKALCLYAHNWQDFRRKPHLFQYTNILCPNWRSDTFLCVYSDGCSLEANCKYCHGWKEQQYHPLDYKTKACPEGKKCSRGGSCACPFYHSINDKRASDKLLEVKLAPKNNLIKLHPCSNINDQKEVILQTGKGLQHPVLYYSSFYEDEEVLRKGNKFYAKSEGSNLYLVDNKAKALPKSIISNDYKSISPNQKEPIHALHNQQEKKEIPNLQKLLLSSSKQSTWDEPLFSFLSDNQLTHLFYTLNGNIKLSELSSSYVNSIKLAKLGLSKEDIHKIEVCAHMKADKSDSHINRPHLLQSGTLLNRN